MDFPIPQKNSLIEQTIQALEVRINAGEFSGWLPGERVLSRILEVGRDTIRTALLELEKRGVVSSSRQGMRRKVLISRSLEKTKNLEQKDKTIKVGFLSPLPMERLNQSVLFEIHRIRESLESHKAQFHFVAAAWINWPNALERLPILIEQEQCDFWILYRTPCQIQEWFDDFKIPALVRGQAQDGIGLAQFDLDWAATARHAAGTLWREGHRRVALIVTDPNLKGSVAAIKGLVGFGERGWEVSVIQDNGDKEKLVLSLKRAISLGVSAIVTSRARQALSVLTWCLGQGILIPQRISLISLASESYLKETYPPISHYDANPEIVARKVVRLISRLLSGKKLSSSSAWMFPVEVKGGTIGKV